MLRLVITLAFLALCSCDRPSSKVDFERVSREVHSLDELLKLHEEVVSEQGKDIYFIKPIGRFGREGVQASLNHVAAKGESVATYNNLELIFGVSTYAKEFTGYDVCADEDVRRRLIDMADEGEVPSWQSSKFESAFVSFCEAGGGG